jgi:hypothetical protein
MVTCASCSATLSITKRPFGQDIGIWNKVEMIDMTSNPIWDRIRQGSDTMPNLNRLFSGLNIKNLR